MVELVACLSTGKGSWGNVSRLISDKEWDGIFLITNEFGKANFNNIKNAKMISIKPTARIEDIKEDILKTLKGKLKGPEVAINLISGSGKEHLALLAALNDLKVKYKFIALTSDGIKYL